MDKIDQQDDDQLDDELGQLIDEGAQEFDKKLEINDSQPDPVVVEENKASPQANTSTRSED